MATPTGRDLLAMLVELYADQVGVKVTYEIVDGKRKDDENVRHLQTIPLPSAVS